MARLIVDDGDRVLNVEDRVGPVMVNDQKDVMVVQALLNFVKPMLDRNRFPFDPSEPTGSFDTRTKKAISAYQQFSIKMARNRAGFRTVNDGIVSPMKTGKHGVYSDHRVWTISSLNNDCELLFLALQIPGADHVEAIFKRFPQVKAAVGAP